MTHITLHTCSEASTLCAVYDASVGEVESLPEARSPDQALSEGNHYYVPLGVSGISQEDWESLRPEVKGIIRENFELLAEGRISPTEVDLWSLCIERAAPVCRAEDVLSAESDEDRDHTLHVENPSKFGETVGTIEPHTSDEALAEIAKTLSQLLEAQGEYLADVDEWLEECRDTVRTSCPDWGELSPHLEGLLLQEHPRIRLKNHGKFNPEGRRIILIQVREAAGDGGWEPAVLEVCDEAHQQWTSAGIPFPASLLQQVADRKTNEVLRQARERQKGSTDAARGISGEVIGEVQSLLVEEKRIRKTLADRQETYRKAVVTRCQDALSGVLGSARLSKSLDDDHRARLLKNAYGILVDAIQQVAVLPPVELHPGLVRHAKLDGVWQASRGDLEAAGMACDALLGTLGVDDTLEPLQRSLDQINELVENLG